MLLPEFILTASWVERLAAQERMASLRGLEELKELEGILEPIQKESPGWIAALLLRLKTRSTSREEKPTIPHATDSGQPLRVFTRTHAYFANQGGFKLHLRRKESRPDGTDADSWDSCPLFLTGEVLKGVQYQFPYSPLRYLDVMEAEIIDKSKSDMFVKALAVFQILWLACSVVTRWIRHIPVSQLEIVTFAFAAIALVLYTVNLGKSRNIKVASTITMSKFSDNIHTDRKIRIEMAMAYDFDQFSRGESEDAALRSISRIKRFKHDHSYYNSTNGPLDTVLGFLLPGICFVFGGLHCIAWNYDFPSTQEQMVWRIGSVATAVIPALTVALVVLSSILERSGNGSMNSDLWGMIGLSCLLLGTVVYTAARLSIIAIAFSCLRRAPSDLYLST
ncbi:hypothetical protein MMC30_004238 [Trapelia coarctata]|nr:hypothetical protein [Trapelia coarctata]